MNNDEITQFDDFDFEVDIEARPVAYIRPVSKKELAEQLPEDAPEGPYFALHDEDGRPLALFTDHATAFVAARAHRYSPVSVH